MNSTNAFVSYTVWNSWIEGIWAKEIVQCIQGKEVFIEVYKKNGKLNAGFCLKSDYDYYMKNNRQGASPWEALICFNNPRKALYQIGAALSHLANGKELFMSGADDKRHRVYQKLLGRAGIEYRIERDSGGFMGICVTPVAL